jgi:hypothetical protein
VARKLSRPFIDTSVLIAGMLDLGAVSVPAQRIMQAVADGRLRPMTAWHCCLELYSVTTRLPEELRLAPGDATTLVEEILDRFDVQVLPARARPPFVRAAAEDRVAGGRIYDAHIGEVARRASASMVVTDNRRHFVTLLRHGIRVLSAAELASEQSL